MNIIDQISGLLPFGTNLKEYSPSLIENASV
mgnify:CR=1 FL=1